MQIHLAHVKVKSRNDDWSDGGGKDDLHHVEKNTMKQQENESAGENGGWLSASEQNDENVNWEEKRTD